MDYQFPRIEHIDDVRAAIADRDEFIIAEREWGYVVNYMVSMADTFPEVDTPDMAIRRECRGILFYHDGRIMSRRLHKFFNVNERDETLAHRIDLGQPHVILEKLDGSMITPVVTEAGLRWGTKMGITEVSMQAEEFVARNPNYEQFARMCMEQMNFTPIFEWCSRKQRIVVDYPEDRLVLIAVRDTVTGAYRSLRWMQEFAEMYELDLVETYAGTTSSMEHLIAETRAMTDAEGWIIRFDDGQMLKIKGDWYVRIHKTKDNLVWEKNLIDLMINERLDDTKPYMLAEDLVRVEAFETDFWIGIAETVRRYEDYFRSLQNAGIDRKTWALEHMKTIQQQNPFTPAIVFGQFDGKDVRKMVLDTISKNIGSQTKVDSVRLLWGNAKWNYSFDGDA